MMIAWKWSTFKDRRLGSPLARKANHLACEVVYLLPSLTNLRKMGVFSMGIAVDFQSAIVQKRSRQHADVALQDFKFTGAYVVAIFLVSPSLDRKSVV